MLKNYFKIAFRTLQRDKIYSLINIFGLSFGMTASILIALLLQYEFSFDKFHKNYGRIYRVQEEVHNKLLTEEWTQTCYPIAQELRNTIPEFEQTAVIREIWGECLGSSGDIVFKDDDGFLAEEQIFNIFSFKFIEGKAENSLTGPGKAVLTRSLAQRLFPGEKALGRSFKGSFTKDLIVTGVIEDFPTNSHINPSYLVSFSTVDKIWGPDYKTRWTEGMYRNYVLLRENVDLSIVNSKIENILDSKFGKNNGSLYLKPLEDIHFSSTRESASNTPLPYYAAIALFILTLACVNSINLTTARSGMRQKEIGIRKVVGASRFSLIKQFIGEAVFVSMLAMFISFLLVELYLPIFNSYMHTQLTFNYFRNWQFFTLIVSSFLAVGILSGLYPAFYLSSFQPTSVIKGNFFNGKSGKTNKGVLRKVLVAFQLVISISLILSSLFIFKQVHFMKNKDLGYNKFNLLRCRIEGNQSKSNFTELRNQLLRDPSIVNASVSFNTPFYGNSRWGINWEGAAEDQHFMASHNEVDYNFIKTFEMTIAKGRNFSEDFSTDKEAGIINESFASTIGWENPIGKKIMDNKYTVIGVVKDFHPYTVHSKIPPYFMLLHDGKLNRDNDYCVRISSNNITRSMEFVRSTLKKFFPDKLFEVRVYDENLDKDVMAVYNGVQNTFGFFSTLAVIIALIGLLGLVSFTIRQRIREIGIRKILGAGESGLYLLVMKEFLIPLSVAIILASPGAYIFFVTLPSAYKYQLTAGDFILPLLAVITVTVIVTMRQILNVTKTNPAEYLHYE